MVLTMLNKVILLVRIFLSAEIRDRRPTALISTLEAWDKEHAEAIQIFWKKFLSLKIPEQTNDLFGDA